MPSLFRNKPRRFWTDLLVFLFLIAYYYYYTFWKNKGLDPLGGENYGNVCPQVLEITPNANAKLWQDLTVTFKTPEFKTLAVDWLGGAVRVPTESYDQMGPVGVDPRWDVFAAFHTYLLKAFPLTHTTLKLTKVNTWGLVYHWQGSNSQLKPILLAAHQDVVPVHPNTVDEWEHPPYSGHFDGERIWGRGSSDDKSGLIGIMSSIESLLKQNFVPTRSVVLTFGFDEEASGFHGAAHLAKYLESAYGKNAFALLVDEGAGFGEMFGTVFATPGIAEKGYIDVRVDVSSPGGHSSTPPPHTSIGILSSLLTEFEKNPFEAKLSRNTPVYATLQCWAAHSSDMPSHIKKAVKKSFYSNKSLKDVEDIFFQNSDFKSLAGTTQAIDLIGGGVKSNALPEQAWAVVNHRIATDSSLEELQRHDTKVLKSLAVKFNLSYTAFGVSLSDEDVPTYGKLTLSPFETGLEPAPVTPTDAPPYRLLSGTIKAVYNAYRSIDGSDNIAVAPGIMSGNTDTRFYWNLTEHIYRYNHANNGNSPGLTGPPGIHTVNEHIVVDTFLEQILFFTTLILNADESDVL